MAAASAAHMEVLEGEDDDGEMVVGLGSYGGKVRLLGGGGGCDEEGEAAAAETMLLWGLQQPTLAQPNAFVSQSSLALAIEACGRSLSILQSPSSLITPGVTGSVMWDSGIVLGKFLEHAVDSGMLLLQGKKVVELGSGCGLVGCVSALLGAQVILTDLPDRLRLLRKNVETNLKHDDMRGSAVVKELIWGDDPDRDLIEPLPDYVPAFTEGVLQLQELSNACSAFFNGSAAYDFLGSDVIYSEGAVEDLMETLLQLSGTQTTIILAGELRNDSILEYFLDTAMKYFAVGRVDEAQFHPDYRSRRVAMYVLVKK